MIICSNGFISRENGVHYATIAWGISASVCDNVGCGLKNFLVYLNVVKTINSPL